MKLSEFNYQSILEDNPPLLKDIFISPLLLCKNHYLDEETIQTSPIIYNNYNIKNIITTLHSGFENLTYEEGFKKLFEKRIITDNDYFKLITKKTLSLEFEDVTIYDINGLGFNDNGNHRLMIHRILNYYKLIEEQIPFNKFKSIDFKWIKK